MQNRRSVFENKGAVTIYVCLLLAFMIPALAGIVSLVRFNGMQTTTLCAADMCCDSVLAEYHKELLQEYGLLFIDTAYGGKYGSLDKTEEHMEEYLSYNLNPSKKLSLLGGRNLYRINSYETRITSASRASDDDGAVFRYMAGSYMLDLVGYEYVKNVKDVISVSETVDMDSIDINEKMDETQEDIREGLKAEKGTDWEDMITDTPVNEISKLRAMNLVDLLMLTMGSSEKVSENKTNKAVLISSRNIVKGNGIPDSWEHRNTLEDTLLFNEYIMLMSGNFRKQKEDSVLKYQTEYVISGKDNDRDNLSDVTNRMLIIRGASNTAYFVTDDEKKEQARFLAEVLAFLLECPDMTDAFEVAIDTTWIFFESVLDLRDLMSGKSVPLVKTKENWKLSLDGMISGSSSMVKIVKPEDIINTGEPQTAINMYYQDYLRLLLYMTPEKDRTFRMMDIVEMDIRKYTDNDSFRLDDCVAYMTVYIEVISDYGYEYLYERAFGYE